MRGSFLDLKNLPEKDKKLLFGESIKGTLEYKGSKQTSNVQGEERSSNHEQSTEQTFESAIQKKNTKQNPLQRFVIPYNNLYKSIWDIYLMFLICYSSITTAYYIAFDENAEGGLQTWEIIVEVSFGLDIVLRFFHEYRDPQNFEYIKDIKQIAKHYMKGWFIIDFLAVFPFQAFGNIVFFKLLRILRLPRFLRFLDASRFDQLIDSLLQNTSRQKRMNYLYASKYIYKIFRLVLIATTLTYFLGCLWYFIVSQDNLHEGEISFFDEYGLGEFDKGRRLIMCCYFALTTLSTVGYGDLAPQSNVEKIFGIIIMILGIALFSYIMGNFNDVLTNYDKQMGIVDKSVDLQVWMTSLSKFTNNQPLPRELVQKIDEHFKFFWKNDRLSSLTPNDKYLKQMPKPLKYQLIKYLFDDIFSLFRGFLLINEFRDSPFYYDLAFEFLPRKYDPGEMILKQGEAVHEIYLIKEGSVYISFEHEGKTIGKYFSRGYFFGNYNIFRNIPAEFNFKAIKAADNIQSTKVLAIPKSKLLKLLTKYPEICSRMVENSKRNANSLRDVLKHELKLMIYQEKKAYPTADELEEIFKVAVYNKAKPQTVVKQYVKKNIDAEKIPEVENKLNKTEQAVFQLMDRVEGFNKSVGDELDDITSKLQKVRDQLAARDKIK